MSRFINSIADLTDLRNRDELDDTLGAVLFDLLGPSLLSVWRVVDHRGELRLRERVKLRSGSKGRIAVAELGEVVLADAPVGLHACYHSRSPLAVKSDADEPHCHFFPVLANQDVALLLEMRLGKPLSEYALRLVAGMLRIYRNHLQVLHESDYDALTGLLNRKTFDDYFRRRVSQQAPFALASDQFEYLGKRRPPNSDQQPWLAVIDIDHFKRINDQFGHAYGDEVLLLMARLMRQSTRDTDQVFRFGGEEFVLILAPTEAKFAERVLERLRVAIEAFEFPQVGRVTVSIGYSAIFTDDNGADAFGRADEALYAAKKGGRNRLYSYEALVADGSRQPKSLDGAVVLF
jgi:diguanylate cyclase (GGDEF)-like protein